MMILSLGRSAAELEPIAKAARRGRKSWWTRQPNTTVPQMLGRRGTALVIGIDIAIAALLLLAMWASF